MSAKNLAIHIMLSSAAICLQLHHEYRSFAHCLSLYHRCLHKLCQVCSSAALEHTFAHNAYELVPFANYYIIIMTHSQSRRNNFAKRQKPPRTIHNPQFTCQSIECEYPLCICQKLLLSVRGHRIERRRRRRRRPLNT